MKKGIAPHGEVFPSYARPEPTQNGMGFLMTDTATTTTGGFHVTHFDGLRYQFNELKKRTAGILLHPGITAFPVLYSSPADGSPPDPKEAFVLFAEGARYPVPDVHEKSAEILVVVDGDLYDEHGGTYLPGTRIYGPRGSFHHPGSHGGCLVHAFFPDL